MAANDPVQERQLVLMERMSRRIDSILEGQKKLEDTNAVLQQENAKLKNQLASLEGQAKKKGNKRSKSSRRESNVVIPNDLRMLVLVLITKLEHPCAEFLCLFCKHLAKILFTQFKISLCTTCHCIVILGYHAAIIIIVFNSTAQFYRYFKTTKEREQRIRKGKNEEHKEKCKRSRRLLNKLERRQSSYEMLQASMTPKEKQYYSEILYIDYMSSEESEYEEQEDFITETGKICNQEAIMGKNKLDKCKSQARQNLQNNL
ncbi:unnamed protein product, partial [Pocillopora meandrina]